MIRGRLIVCIASAWDYDPTSKHHLMRILARHNDILWINYRGSRRPEVNATDLRDVWAVLRHVARGVHRAAPSIAQVTPLVIPGATHPLLRRWHRSMVIAQIRRAIRAVKAGRAKPIQLWTFAPDVPFLLGAFQEECSIYYCVDEYRQFDGFDADGITVAENELTRRADVVVTTSEPLLRTKRAQRPDTVLVRHGVDYDHFAAAWRTPLQPPADLVDIPQPVFGFFGLIHHWVDRSFLAEVARLRPSYSFVLLGECKIDVSELEALGNVFLLGRRPYCDLPAYAAAFDAGMLLFTRHSMTRHVNPVKMYEYLASGLPIISTPLPEAERLNGPVTIADTPQRFADACDHAVARKHRDREAISRIVRNETWLAKVEYLSDLVLSRIPPVVHTATRPAAEVGVIEAWHKTPWPPSPKPGPRYRQPVHPAG